MFNGGTGASRRCTRPRILAINVKVKLTGDGAVRGELPARPGDRARRARGVPWTAHRDSLPGAGPERDMMRGRVAIVLAAVALGAAGAVSYATAGSSSAAKTPPPPR